MEQWLWYRVQNRFWVSPEVNFVCLSFQNMSWGHLTILPSKVINIWTFALFDLFWKTLPPHLVIIIEAAWRTCGTGGFYFGDPSPHLCIPDPSLVLGHHTHGLPRCCSHAKHYTLLPLQLSILGNSGSLNKTCFLPDAYIRRQVWDLLKNLWVCGRHWEEFLVSSATSRGLIPVWNLVPDGHGYFLKLEPWTNKLESVQLIGYLTIWGWGQFLLSIPFCLFFSGDIQTNVGRQNWTFLMITGNNDSQGQCFWPVLPPGQALQSHFTHLWHDTRIYLELVPTELSNPASILAGCVFTW